LRRAGHVIAVSREDAERMENLFGARDVSSIATAVDIGYFKRPERCSRGPTYASGLHGLDA